MKKTENIKFANAVIELDESNKYIITETKKDNTFEFNLSEILEQYLGVEGISLSLGKIEEIEE